MFFFPVCFNKQGQGGEESPAIYTNQSPAPQKQLFIPYPSGFLGRARVMLVRVRLFFFYLPDPLTMWNMSFKGLRRVMLGETIYYFGACMGVNSQLWVVSPLP